MSYYQTTQVSVAGLGSDGAAAPANALYEYTSAAVANQYNQDIQVLANYYAGNLPAPAGTPLSQSDVNAIAGALQDMMNLAQNGLVSSIGNGPSLTYYLTTGMAQDLDLLVRSFQSVGGSPSTAGGGLTLQQVQAWLDLSKTSSVVQSTLSDALNTLTGNTTLQALIETAYVGTANDMISNELGTLQSALQTTTNVVNSLSALQNIHNDLVVSSRPSFQPLPSWDPTGNTATGSTLVASYKALASAHFGNPIVPVPSPTVMGIHGTLTPRGLSTVNQLIALRTSLQQEIAALSALGTSVTSDPSGVYAQLKTVLGDLNSNFSVVVGGVVTPIESYSSAAQKSAGLTQWLSDFYSASTGPNASAANAGIIQADLTNAISSAQSINNTQQEAVRNYLYIFQQYYQSASAILQSITQIIQRIAQGIKQ